MLWLISGISYWVDIVIAVLFIIGAIACAKWHKLGYVLFGAFTIFLGFCSAFSIRNLDTYYSAEGGIIGAITGTNQNEVVVEEMSFDFKDVVFTATGAENEFEAKFVTDKTFALNKSKYIQLLVNGQPCDYLVNASDYIVAEYNYVFYDRDMNPIGVDTLTFHMSFYDNFSLLIVTTNGGESAVEKWNYFFNVNKFIVTIEQVNDIYISESIKNLEEYATVNLNANSQLYSKILVKKGTLYVLPTTANVDGYKFNNWIVDGQVVTEIVVNNDINISADLTKMHTVVIKSDGEVVKTMLVEDGYKITINDFPTVSKENYYFSQWQSHKGYMIPGNASLTVYEDTEFNAIFSTENGFQPDTDEEIKDVVDQPNSGR